MAWTEPGKNPKKEPEAGPPDLDELLQAGWRKLKQRFGAPSEPNTSNSPSHAIGLMMGLVLILAVLVWLASGILIIAPAEQGVVQRLGQYQTMLEAGPHWYPRFIDSVTVVNVQKISTYSYEAQMLTRDQNIVDVSVAVQYRIVDPKAYLFNVTNPLESLRQATASSLRQVVGNTNLDDILTTGRGAVRDALLIQINTLLSLYQSGIMITDVALQPAKAPEQVKDAFDEAIKAQEDEQRYMNQSEAYAKEVVSGAEGKSKRIHEESQAYREQVVLTAEGDVERYLAILPAYHEAPEVTRKRLYLNSMQALLENKNKVLLDTRSQQNVLYLPLDKLNTAKPNQSLMPTTTNTNTEGAVVSAMTAQSETATHPAAKNNALWEERIERSAFMNPDSEVGKGGSTYASR